MITACIPPNLFRTLRTSTTSWLASYGLWDVVSRGADAFANTELMALVGSESGIVCGSIQRSRTQSAAGLATLLVRVRDRGDSVLLASVTGN